jgi:hypothetical protein
MNFAFVILNSMLLEWPEDYHTTGGNTSTAPDIKSCVLPYNTGTSFDSLNDSPKTLQRYVVTEKSESTGPFSILKHKKKGISEQMANM